MEVKKNPFGDPIEEIGWTQINDSRYCDDCKPIEEAMERGQGAVEIRWICVAQSTIEGNGRRKK